MKRFVLMLIFFAVLASAFSAGKKDEDPKPLYFDETWGYVSMAKASEYRDDLPLTDVCYFSADVNCYGELISVPKIDAIPVEGKRRHMVFICDSKSLTHFVLDPQYGVRANIISQLIEAVQPFEGLNIDMELVPARDRDLFLSFVAELRERLPEKILSVCVPARVRRLQDDVYPYKEIANLCDRVFIMAYDEHWSGGVPGPVASPQWCNNVAAYALKSIPQEKIIMGLPFYGRTWADKSTSGAWYYETAMKRLEENNVDNLIYEDGIPTFSFTTEVKVTGYLNDVYSLWHLADSYKKVNIGKIGYWRIGQEDPAVWDFLLVK
ncbi:MAG: glycosyl hydrolase family 18 protein [Treponema sp.]|nr:glycosyl hydrolase family 18 protein [Treponema sp.]